MGYKTRTISDHGDYGVMVTQQVVVLLSWVRSPLVTPRKSPHKSGDFRMASSNS